MMSRIPHKNAMRLLAVCRRCSATGRLHLLLSAQRMLLQDEMAWRQYCTGLLEATPSMATAALVRQQLRVESYKSLCQVRSLLCAAAAWR